MRLRKLFFYASIASIACATAGIVWRWACVGNYGFYEHQLFQVQGIHSLLIEYERGGINDMARYATSASFEVTGLPDSYMRIGLSSDLFSDAKIIYLCRIGRMRLLVEKFEAGKSRSGCVPIGAASPLIAQLPFKINTVQDLVDAYPELEDFFSRWPVYPQKPLVAIGTDGERYKCYVETVNE